MNDRNKPLRPIYDEWWRKGPIAAASKQHQKDVRLAFYVGVYTAMGLIGKTNKLPPDTARSVAQDMIDECKEEIMPSKLKFVASINGEKI